MSVLRPFDPWRGRLCTCPKKYSLSPYTGCQHACQYCYITAYIPKAFQCRAKRNFIQRLKKDLLKAFPLSPVSLANSSDPYPPVEKDLRLTRETLRILMRGGIKVLIITKSDLIIRDVDVIKRGNCSVSISITTLDEAISRRLEPGAPSPSRRLQAVKKLTREGIPCSVRLDPIIPHLTDRKLDELIKAIANSGAKHVVSSTYKAKMDSFSRITSTFPQLKHELTQLYWVKGERIGRARYLPAKVRVELFTELKRSVERWGMTFATCREGLKRLQSGGSCDGSHLIPIRRRLWKGALRMLNKGNMALI